MLPLLLTTIPFASLVLSWPTLPQLIDQSSHLSSTLLKANATGWVDPSTGGGRMLDFTNRRYGEPLNVIISGQSDPRILTLDGLHRYANSIGFAEECLGLHIGDIHQADLGDGQGRTDEQFLARQTYFPILGTCWQSLVGGHHFRAWQQKGSGANTRAWFLATSKEMDSGQNHAIVPNGYNIGRDWLVEHAVAGSSWRGMWWKAEVEWREGLLDPGSKGVNHNISQDGRTAILTVLKL